MSINFCLAAPNLMLWPREICAQDYPKASASFIRLVPRLVAWLGLGSAWRDHWQYLPTAVGIPLGRAVLALRVRAADWVVLMVLVVCRSASEAWPPTPGAGSPFTHLLGLPHWRLGRALLLWG